MDDKLRGRILAQMQSGDAAAAGFYGHARRVAETALGAGGGGETRSAGHQDAHAHRARRQRRHRQRAQQRPVCARPSAGPRNCSLLDRSHHMVTIDQERNVVGDATARFAWNLLFRRGARTPAAVAREPVPPRRRPLRKRRTPPPRHLPLPRLRKGWKKRRKGRGDDRADRLLWIANMSHTAAGSSRRRLGRSIPPGRAASRTGSAWLPGLGCGSASAATCSSFRGWRSFRRLSSVGAARPVQPR